MIKNIYYLKIVLKIIFVDTRRFFKKLYFTNYEKNCADIVYPSLYYRWNIAKLESFTLSVINFFLRAQHRSNKMAALVLPRFAGATHELAPVRAAALQFRCNVLRIMFQKMYR